jgi:hypothetical protein
LKGPECGSGLGTHDAVNGAARNSAPMQFDLGFEHVGDGAIVLVRHGRGKLGRLDCVLRECPQGQERKQQETVSDRGHNLI